MGAISAIIITRNEACNIERCLLSLQTVADEVLVFDSQSTDATRDICLKHGAQVINADWKGYAATKNAANQQANHPYILSIDADEALSDTLRQGIMEVKEELNGAYCFNRLNYYCGRWMRHGGLYPDRKVRLFPREAAQWQGDYVHEELVVERGVPVTRLKGDLLHYSYYNIDDHLQRIGRYSSLAAEELRATGKAGIIKMLLSPAIRFKKGYLFRGGFRDGLHGFVWHNLMAVEVFLKYAKALLPAAKQGNS